jgi:hypothetical protein
MQLEAKNDRIQALEDLVGQVQSTNPNFENILRAKLDEQKKSFEEKSSKILAILRKKDMKIEELKNEVERNHKTIEGYRHQQEKLESKLQQSTHTLGHEADVARSKANSSVLLSASERELAALREKSADQSDQIQVLLTELSKFKTNHKDSDQQLLLAQSEIAHLKRELERANRKMKTIQVMKQSVKDKEAMESTKENMCPTFEIQAEGGLATTTPQTFKLRSSDIEGEAKRLGEATEAHYRALVEELELQCVELQRSLKESLNDKGAILTKAHELEEKLMKVETDNQLLRHQVQNQAADSSFAHCLHDKSSIPQAAEPKANPPTTTEAKGKVDQNTAHEWWSYVWHMLSSKDEKEQTLRRISDTTNTAGASHPGDFAYSPDDMDEVSINVHILKLKENIRMQAIELSTSRQEILGLKLKQRQELSDLRQELEQSRRENVRLAAVLKHKAKEKEVKVAEMAATIKVLSGRSDLHIQLASTRSEVEVEKLTSLQLRMELDDRLTELLTTQKRMQAIEDEAARLHGLVDSMDVIHSFGDIPGVKAATALELVADEICRCRAQVDSQSRELRVAKEHVEALQKQLVHTQQQQNQQNQQLLSPGSAKSRKYNDGNHSTANPATAASVSSRRTSMSLASSGGAGVANADLPIGELAMEDAQSTYMRPSPLSQAGGVSLFDDVSELDRLVIDESTTPKMLLQSLDLVSMRNRIALQNTTIAQLRDDLKRFKELKPLSDESFRAHHLDVLTTEEVIELQNRSKKLDVVTVRHEELLQEMNKLRKENIELERNIAELSRSKLQLHSTMAVDPSAGAASAAAGTGGGHDLFHMSVSNASSSSVSMLVDLLQDYSNELPPNLRERFEEVLRELEQKDQLLKDRTSQLKVLMESFDALQMTSSGIPNIPDMTDPSDKRKRSGLSGLEALAFDASGAFSNHKQDASAKAWIVQPLVKRVVELTVQTSSMLAQTDLDAQRICELEHQLKSSQRQANKFQAMAHKLENANAQLAVTMQGLKEELRVMDEERIQSSFQKHEDRANLVQALHETETQLQDRLLEIEELRQLNQSLSSKDEEWMLHQLRGIFQSSRGSSRPLASSSTHAAVPGSPASVLSYADLDAHGGATPGRNESRAPNAASEQATANAVTQTLQECIQQIRGAHLDGRHQPITIAPPKVSTFASVNASVARISKYEQKFYQRLSDLVLSAAKAASASDRHRLHHETQNALLSAENAQLRQHLVAFAQRFYGVRKQCLVYEQLVRQGRTHGLVKQSRLVQQLRHGLSEEKKQSKLLSIEIMSLRRKVIGLSTSQHWARRAATKLQATVAILESKGGSYLQAKETLQRQMQEKIGTLEASFQQWFRSELPRLVAGVPIIEEDLARLPMASMTEFLVSPPESTFAAAGHNAFGTGGASSITDRLMQQAGVDRNFGLVTALCASKAAQVATQATADELRERLRLQKERTTVLEGVIAKWRDSFETREEEKKMKKKKAKMMKMMKTMKMKKSKMKTRSKQTSQLRDASGGAYIDYDTHFLVDSLDDDNVKEREHGVDDDVEVDDKEIDNLDDLDDDENEEFPSQAELEELFRKERALLEMNESLVQRVQTLEEDVIESQGRLAQSEAAQRLTQKLLDQTYAEVEEQKTRAMQQLSRVRTDIERQHAEELRSVREAYENERAVMMRELHVANHLVRDDDDERASTATGRRSRGLYAAATTTGKYRVDDENDDDDDNDDNGDEHDFGGILSSLHDVRRRSRGAASRQQQQRQPPKGSNYHHHHHHRDHDDDAGDDDRLGRDETTGADDGRGRKSVESSPLSRPTIQLPRPQSPFPPPPPPSSHHHTLRLPHGRHVGHDYDNDHDHDNDNDTNLMDLSDRGDEATTAAERDESIPSTRHQRRPRRMESRTDFASSAPEEEEEGDVDDAMAAMTKLSDTSSASAMSATMRMQQTINEDSQRRQQMLHQRRLQEAQDEIRELNKVITRLKRQLQEQKKLHAQSQPPLKTTTTTASSAPAKSSIDHIVQETAKESSALWPGLQTLTSELTDILATIAQRLDEDSDLMDLVKASVAMTHRIQLSARHVAAAPSSSSADATATPSAPAMMAVDSGTLLSSEAMLPERYQFLIRDLRQRVTEVETTYSRQLQEERTRFAVERADLVRAKDEATAMAQEVGQRQELQHQQLKDRYERALREAQDTLTVHTEALKQELRRVEDKALSLSQQLAVEKEQHHRLRTLVDQQQLFFQTQHAHKQLFDAASVAPASVASAVHSSPPDEIKDSAMKGGEAVGEDFVALQRQLTTTQDELEATRRQQRQASQAFKQEVASLKEDYERYRNAHETIVRSLEEQLEESQAQSSLFSSSLRPPPPHPSIATAAAAAVDASQLSQSSWSMQAPSVHPPAPLLHGGIGGGIGGELSSVDPQQNISDLKMQLQRLTYKYNTKCAEFNSLMRMVTTGRHGSDLPSSATTSGDVESDAADTAKELKQQMMAVRLTAAETEVERLRKELRRELDRKRAHVPTQQQQGQLHARRSTTKPPKPATNKQRHTTHSSTSASMSRPRNVGGEYGYHDDAYDDEEDEDEDEDEDEFAADEGEEVARDDDDDSDEGTGRHGQAATPQSIARTLLRRCKTRGDGDDDDDVWTLPARLQIDEDAQALVRRVHDLRRRTATDLQRLLSALRGRRRRRPPAAPTTTTTTTTTPTTTATTPTPAKATATTTTITAPSHSSTNAASASSSAAVAVATVKSLKSQIAQLREDIARKNKVIVALKEAKAADANALEQWKNEARLLDEAHKRLQRALTAKEAVVKDLRQKLDQALEASQQQQQQQQQQLLHHGNHGDHGDGGERDGTEARTGDIYLLNAQELRSRLKEYDLERARYRARLQATRDKVQELEAQLASLAQENEALKKGQDKVAEYKVIVARKESLILSLRGQLDVKQKEFEALQSQEQQKQVDAERRIRSLQRQVDAALRHQQEFERETALLRQRVTQAVEHDKKRELTHRASGLHQQQQQHQHQHQHQAKAPPGAFHFSLQGQQAPMSPASTVVPSAAARMHRAVAFAPSNSATQRLSDVSRSLLPSDDALYPIGDVDDSDLNSSSTATRGHQHQHQHYHSNNNNNNNHDHHHHHRSSTKSPSQSRGDDDNDDDVESLLMQTLGISAQRPSSNIPSSSFLDTNHANANENAHVSAMGGGTSDLLARLTGLAHILPPPPPSHLHHHNHPSVLDQTDSQSLLNLSSPSVSQPNHNHTNNNSNSNNSSSSGGSVSADPVHVDGLSSAEKRLQALVDAALLSPARK